MTFNSIEWIRVWCFSCAGRAWSAVPFNSIEWIPQFPQPFPPSFTPPPLSIPLNGFELYKKTKGGWDGFRSFNSIEWIHIQVGRGGSPACGDFQFHWMDSRRAYQGAGRVKVAVPFQFHWMDSESKVFKLVPLSFLLFQFHWMDSAPG